MIKFVPKYPHVKVNLIGIDGNAFAIIGEVKIKMKRGGCTEEQIEEYRKEAMKDDYEHLLITTMKYVEVV